jgi:hypothetical protein
MTSESLFCIGYNSSGLRSFANGAAFYSALFLVFGFNFHLQKA